MRKQEIEGQLELDLMTGTVKETPKKKTVARKNKKVKTDIPVRQNDTPQKQEEETKQTASTEEPEHEEKPLEKKEPEEGIAPTFGQPKEKKEIVPEVLHNIEEHLATVGSIHIGTIMRICRLSAVEATAYYETLLANGRINVKGRSAEKRLWTDKSEKGEEK